MRPEAARPGDAVLAAAVGLGRGLRERGVPCCADQELTFCRALAEVDLRRRDQVYWAARASMVHARDDLLAFEAAFARFWEGLDPGVSSPRAEHGESDPRMDGREHGGESIPQFRMEGRSAHLVDGSPSRATREVPSGAADEDRHGPRMKRGLLAAWSPEEQLVEKARLDYLDEELAAVRRLAEELRRSAPERLSRRRSPAHRGRIDLRAMLHGSLATDGEPLRPRYTGRISTTRRLVVVCDVSGSMERYSRSLLAALQGVAGAAVRAECFVFATRLTRITGDLAGRDYALALGRARAAIDDWSGGTRIGPALADLNREWGRRGILRGSIVIVVSDGWDRGDPALLATELDRVRLQARRLVWINPRPAELGGQPLATGLRAALPLVDDYVGGHDPRALDRLAALVGGFGTTRPARPRRAVGWAPR